MATLAAAPPLLKVREAAELLGVSQAHAYRMCRDGVLPCTRLTPGGIRVPKWALEEWLRNLNDDALSGIHKAGVAA